MSKKIIFVITAMIILICCMQSCSKNNMPITTVTEDIGTDVKDTSSIPSKDIGCGTSLPNTPEVIGCSTPEPYTLEEFYAEKQKNNYNAFIRIEDIFPQIPQINKYVSCVKHIDDSNKGYGYWYYLGDESSDLMIKVKYSEKAKDNKLSSYLSESVGVCVDDFSKIEEGSKKYTAVVQKVGSNEISYEVYSGRITEITMTVDGAIVSIYIPSYYSDTDKSVNLDEIKAKDPCYDLIKALMSEGSEREQIFNTIRQSIKDNVEYGNPTIKN